MAIIQPASVLRVLDHCSSTEVQFLSRTAANSILCVGPDPGFPSFPHGEVVCRWFKNPLLPDVEFYDNDTEAPLPFAELSGIPGGTYVLEIQGHGDTVETDSLTEIVEALRLLGLEPEG